MALEPAELRRQWETDPRWRGIRRDFTAEDVVRLRGSVQEEHTLARLGAERLWHLLHEENYVAALGALTGNQAVQQVRAGLRSIYVSGWQVAADANAAAQTYPDQSLYPVNSVPLLESAASTTRCCAPTRSPGRKDARTFPWLALARFVADADAGFGSVLNTFELMKSMIAAGSAAMCTSKTSSRPLRSAATSAARCSFRSGSTSGR